LKDIYLAILCKDFTCNSILLTFGLSDFRTLSTFSDYFCAANILCMKILMVCLGNICRSPLAEGILQQKAWNAGLNWSVESAGTNGYHIGEPPHYLSQKVAGKYGIDIGRQRSRRIRPEDFEQFDKIYAMSEDVIEEMKFIVRKKYDAGKVDLLMNEVYPGENVDVPDPWYGPEAGYHEVYKMIDHACDKIINKYANSKMCK
jgi:protein-tyrosine phosphatase